MSFVDQNRSAPRVQQWSADLQREIGNGMALTFTYMGAKGDHLPLGGSNEVPVNLNQLDPKYLALGSAALAQQLPNPFLGNPNVPASLVDAGHAGPFAAAQAVPAVRNVYARQVTEGQNTYEAGIIEWTKRPSHGWGGRASYTYSVLKDNQIGETNFYSAVGGTPLNNYNYNPSAPACAAGQQFTTACYDPRAE